MPRKAFVFRSEPQGAVFRDLLNFSNQHCRSFSLEWIEGGPVMESVANPPLEPTAILCDE